MMKSSLGLMALYLLAGGLGAFLGYASGGSSGSEPAGPKLPRKTSRELRTRPGGASKSIQVIKAKVDWNLVDWLREASDEDLRAAVMANYGMFGTLREAPPGLPLDLMVNELAARDPAGSFEFFCIKGTHDLVDRVFTHWIATDPWSAAMGVVKISGLVRITTEGMFRDAVTALARTDPDRAWKLLEELPATSSHQVVACGIVVAVLMQTDEERVLELVGRELLGATDAYTSRDHRFMGAWKTSDPSGALAWLVKQEESVQKRWMPGFLSDLAKDDPGRFLPELYEFNRRTGLAQTWIHGHSRTHAGEWLERDSDGALRWIEEDLDDRSKSLVLKNAVNRFLAKDPDLAFRLLEAGQSSAAVNFRWEELMRRQADRLPPETVLRLLDFVPEAERPRIDALLRRKGVLESTLEQALEDLGSAKNARIGRQQGGEQSLAASKWLERDPDQFLRSLASQSPEVRAAALGLFGMRLAGGDPMRLVEMGKDLEDPDKFFDVAAQSVAAYLAKSRPKEAMAMVEAFPDGQARELGIENVARFAMVKDQASTLQWLRSLPEGSLSEGRARQLGEEFRLMFPELQLEIDAALSSDSSD